MIDYSKWIKDEIDVTNIDVDQYNPRLPEDSKSLSQNELINYLIDNYSIYDDVAKSIVQKGYYPLKYIVVIKASTPKRYIVIEGNRRIAALKAIINADIVNQKSRNKFIRLSEQIEVKTIKKVPVLIAPSRESVVPLLFSEHAQNPTRKWSLIMKAEFYANELKSGRTIEELSQECDLPVSEIKDALKLLNMYKIACHLDLDAETMQKVRDKENFQASTLERIYNSKLFQEKMKFAFDEEGNVIGKSDKDEFATAYKKIITDIATGTQKGGIDSRSINSDDDKKAYLDKIDSFLPKKKGTFYGADFVPILNNGERTLTNPTQKNIKRSNRTPKGLVTQGVVFKLNSAACIKKIYDALKSISVNKYPVPSAILLRVLLDKTLRYNMRIHKVNKIRVIENKIEIDKKIDDITLKQMLEYISTKENPFNLDNGIIKVIKKFQTSSSNASLTALNNVIHNPDYTLNEAEVREIWSNLEGLLKEILVEK